MAIVLKDRVKETAAAPGTGTITLAGAASGFQAFSAIGNGNTTYFAIVDSASGAWEVNYGTYTSSGATLSRNATPLSSSNAGALVNFTGTVDVFCTYPSEKAIYEEVTGNVLIDGGPITVVGNGVTTYTTFSAALGELYANINSFAQLYAQNLNNGAAASSDFVAYNDLGDGVNNFVDVGINSSNYSDATYPIFTPGSAYAFNDGGEMFVGSATDDLVLFAGGTDVTDEAVRVDKTTKAVTTAADVNVGGALSGVGGSFTAAVTSSSASVTNPANNEFVTKAYVDNVATTGIHIHTPVVAETSAALSAVYTQGGTTFNITNITGGNTVVTSTTHGLSVDDQIWLTTTAGNGLSINTPYFVYATPTGTSLQLTATWNGPLLTGLTNASGLSYATRANSGVGAYLEASANQALPISGVTTSDRVLVYNQSTTYWNGVYTITSLGSGASKWKLTRATDADYYSPSDTNGLSEGDYFFVQSNSEAYVLTTPGAIIIGYTGITYTLFSSVPVYTGTSPINVTGTVISLTTVPATLGGTGTATVTTGDLLYGSGTNTWGKLAAGAGYRPLVMNAGGTNVEWNALALDQSGTVSGSLPATNGGTGLNSYTLGDTIYSSAANTLLALSGNTTTTKKFLTQTGTGSASAAPAWGTISGSDVSGNISGSAGSVANALTLGTYLTGTSFNGSSAVTATVDATSANTASKVVARDSSGNFSAGTITATLSGAATSATTATNLASGAANQIAYQTGSGATAFATAPTVSSTYLYWNGSAFAWGAVTSGTVTSITAGTYLTGGTITSSGTIAVDATSANTASKVVARDASGNFSAGTITATLSGNASTATQVSNSLTLATSGTGLSGSATFNGSSAQTFTVTSNATSANTVSTIVARDASGNFSAGTITATLSGNATSATTATSATSATTATTATTANALNTSNNYQVNSLGVGTAGSGTAGEIRATNNVTAYYSSDIKFKENVREIPNAAATAAAIGGKLFDWKDSYIEEHGGEDGYFIVKADFGVIAQDVLAKFPVAVRTRPDGSLAVDYEKLSALALAANAEHEARIAKLEALVAKLI